MHIYLFLLVESSVSVIASLAVLYALSRPLVEVLGRICPDEQAARFWLSYTRVMLVIAPLLLVLAVDLLTHGNDFGEGLRLALMAVLSGLLGGLYLIGQRLGRFVVIPREKGEAS